MASSRIRYSIDYIQQLYTSGQDKTKLENLIRAFRGIQALPPDHPDSFFRISGYHGLPFRGPGETDPTWYGGYCWHSSVLFPTWHRAYLLRLEDALRNVPGCKDVTLPYWDELSNLGATSPQPIPSIFTSPQFPLDGRNDNPLFSYKLQKALVEKVSGANNRYSKHLNYETVRYPLSGLVGTDKDRKQTDLHNSAYQSQGVRNQILNKNVYQWLKGTVKFADDGHDTPAIPDTYSIQARYIRCLLAPNYTVFSNVASQSQWINDNRQSANYVVSLEDPHNAIHLAVGGFYQEGAGNADAIIGANGDMGDNETASFDPIFFFHHCYIDYTFSRWQIAHKLTKRGSLTVIKDYPGTILDFGQPPNFPPGTQIGMTTPLEPFEKPGGGFYTSEDVTDFENDLHYTYGVGSLHPLIHTEPERNADSSRAITTFAVLDQSILTGAPNIDGALHSSSQTATERSGGSSHVITNFDSLDQSIIAGSIPNVESPFSLTKRVCNISRADYAGSFVIRLVAKGHDGQEIEVGRQAVLSRWNVHGCRNCQNHLDVEMYVPIHENMLEALGGPDKKEISWAVHIQTHDELLKFPHAHRTIEQEKPQVVDL